MPSQSLDEVVDHTRHQLDDSDYIDWAKQQLDDRGMLVLEGFLKPDALRSAVAEAEQSRELAFHSQQFHNVYLEKPDQELPPNNARSRTIISTKGAVTTDLIAADSVLRVLYDSPVFQSFLCAVLDEDALYPYADPLSSININYYNSGEQLGWHFDNSSFSVTLLIQEGMGGGVFQFIPNMRDSDSGFDNEEAVARVLDGNPDVAPTRLNQAAGDLVLFRGRDALHHVSPVDGERTRLLVVLAYNTEPGLSLSENARMTFFGRLN